MTPLIPLVIGIFAILKACFWDKKYQRLSKNGNRAEGSIVDFEKEFIIWKKYATALPVISFITNEGKTIIKTANLRNDTLARRYKLGDKVTVLYSSNDPEEFFIKSPHRDSEPFTSFFIGAVALIITILLFFFPRLIHIN